MIRLSMLIVALWTIVAAPLLCVAGVVAHACHCEADCICEDESECEEDPCGDPFLRKSESREAPSSVGAALSLPASRCSVPMPNPRSPLFRAPDRAPPLGPPHASDLPLLS